MQYATLNLAGHKLNVKLAGKISHNRQPIIINDYNFSGECEIKLSDIMKFLTGSSTVPPSRLANKLTVIFKHWCTNLPRKRICKPSVSTCSLTLTIPVYYSTMLTMEKALEDVVKLSQGFDS